jgi:hypothetical protein
VSAAAGAPPTPKTRRRSLKRGSRPHPPKSPRTATEREREKRADVEKGADVFFYRDFAEKTHGPFTPAKMQKWDAKGYFEDALRVGRRKEGPFERLGDARRRAAARGLSPFASRTERAAAEIPKFAPKRSADANFEFPAEELAARERLRRAPAAAAPAAAAPAAAAPAASFWQQMSRGLGSVVSGGGGTADGTADGGSQHALKPEAGGRGGGAPPAGAATGGRSSHAPPAPPAGISEFPRPGSGPTRLTLSAEIRNSRTSSPLKSAAPPHGPPGGAASPRGAARPETAELAQKRDRMCDELLGMQEGFVRTLEAMLHHYVEPLEHAVADPTGALTRANEIADASARASARLARGRSAGSENELFDDVGSGRSAGSGSGDLNAHISSPSDDAPPAGISRATQPALSAPQIKTVFKHLRPILQLHEGLLQQFRGAPPAGDPARLSAMARGVQRFGPFLKLHFVYVQDLDAAQKLVSRALAEEKRTRPIPQEQAARWATAYRAAEAMGYEYDPGAKLGPMSLSELQLLSMLKGHGTLESMLIQPMQQLVQLKEMMKRFAKHCRLCDSAVARAALAQVETANMHCNNEMKEKARQEALFEAFQRLPGLANALPDRGDDVVSRRVVKEGWLWKRSRHGKFQKKVFCLLTDVLCYGRPEGSVLGAEITRGLRVEDLAVVVPGEATGNSGDATSEARQQNSLTPQRRAGRPSSADFVVPGLEGVAAVAAVDGEGVDGDGDGDVDADDAKWQHVFTVFSQEKSFVVAAASLAERDAWVSAVRAARREFQQRKRDSLARGARGGAAGAGATGEFGNLRGGSSKFRAGPEAAAGHSAFRGGGGRRPRSVMAPVWKADAKNCSLCGAKFTSRILMAAFTDARRRHHCRRCGACICNECSPHRWRLENLEDEKPQRVCTVCHKALTDGKLCYLPSTGAGARPAGGSLKPTPPAAEKSRGRSLFRSSIG